MPQLTTPYYPKRTGDIKQDLDSLTNHVSTLIEDLQYVLNNLDAGNVIEAAKVRAENIDTTNAKVANAQIQTLKAGKIWGELIAGEKVTVSNEGGNFALDGNGMIMENENGTFAITKRGVYISELDLIIERTIQEETKTDPAILTRVILQNYIAGGSGSPSVNQPILIQKKVGDGEWVDIFSIDSNGNLRITGKLIGSEFWNSTEGAYMTLGTITGNYGDLQIFRNNDLTPVFQIYDDVGQIMLKSMGTTFLRTWGSDSQPNGNWNFSEATSVSGLSTDSVNNHNHGIDDGTWLMRADGTPVQWTASGGHSHNVGN